MEYGQVDGHGRYGILDTDEAGLLVCHECGQARQFLGRHVRVHGLSAYEYRERHGLARTVSLAAAGLRERFGEASRGRVGSAAWLRFEQARDPDRAREASVRAVGEPTRAGVLPGKRERAAVASRSRARGVCSVAGCGRPVVGRGWCQAHYGRWQRSGDVQADVPIREWTRGRR